MEGKFKEAGPGIKRHFSHRFHFFLFDLHPEYWSMMLAQLLAVVGIFAGMLLCLAFLGAVLIKLHLYNAAGLLISSIGTALIFSVGSLGLIELSRKFEDWTIEAELGYAGDIFLGVFVISLVLTYIVFANKNRS